MTTPTGLPEGGTSGPEEAAVPTGRRRRSRTVLYSSLAVAILIAVMIAVLASAKPSSNGTTTNTLVGKPAPAVSGPALTGGGRYSLSQFAGKWVVVNFAASWCVPCRQETPQLLSFYSQQEKSGQAVILTVAFDPTDVSALASFLASSGAKWPAVNDTSAEVAYGVSEIPQSFLVSPGGVVAAKFFGAVTAAELDKVIATYTGTRE